jgi:hypothetical protein
VSDRPINRVIGALRERDCKPKSNASGQWEACCPAHEDKHASLSVKECVDGTVVVHCHASCNPDAIAKALGLEMRDLFPPKDGPRSPTKKPSTRSNGRARRGHRRPEHALAFFVKDWGGTLSSLGPWVYKDRVGVEVMRIYRIDLPSGGKKFLPIYRDSDSEWHAGDPPGSVPLYHLDELDAADTVFVCEGEKCADLVKTLGLVATTSSHGAKSAKKTDWTPLAGKTVVLIPDHDKPGEAYVTEVGAILAKLDPPPIVKILRLPLKNEGDDIEQWLDAQPEMWEDADIARELVRLTAAAAIVGTYPFVVRADRVDSRKVKWLWPNRIPFGFITIFAGRTGIGKTFVALDVVARLSRGDCLPDNPDGPRLEPGNVLIISEDSHEFVLRPRLDSLKADPTRIHFMTWEAMANFQLGDTDMLGKAVKDAGDPALVVIDPPQNFLGNIDEHRNSEVRGVLMKLVGWLMAQSRPVALVLITQVTKGSKEVEALSRIIGSVAWGATSRIAHTFAPDQQAPGQGLFCCPKSNIGPIPKTLSYRIVAEADSVRLEWLGESDKSADEAMNGGKKEQNRCVTAESFLVECFNKQHEWLSDTLEAKAKEMGISHGGLWEAKKSLEGIVSIKRGKVWSWAVPLDWEHLQKEGPKTPETAF